MKTVKLLLFIIITTLNSYAQLNNGLKAYYTFGGNTNDTSGQNNNGILIGNPVLTSDRFETGNCAFQFPGDTLNYIKIPFSTDFDIADTNAFSISLWYQGGTSSIGDFEVLFEKNNPTVTPHPSDYHLGLYDANKPSFGSLYSPIVMPPNAPTIPDLNWHHIVAIYDNKNWYIYQNDTLRDSDLTQTYGIFQSAGDISIGKGFEGKIDDIRFYNRILTANEINQLFTFPSSCQSTTASDCSYLTVKNISIREAGTYSEVDVEIYNSCSNCASGLNGCVYMELKVIKTVSPFDTIASSNCWCLIGPDNNSSKTYTINSYTYSQLPPASDYRISLTCGSEGCDTIPFNLSTGIATSEKFNLIQIYPNPTSNHIVINVPATATSYLTVKLTDLTGKVLNIKKLKADNEIIDLSHLAKGLYIIEILDTTNTAIKTFKITKE